MEQPSESQAFSELLFSELLFSELLFSELLFSELLFSELLFSELLFLWFAHQSDSHRIAHHGDFYRLASAFKLESLTHLQIFLH